jgi:hypothetical protein
MSISHTTQAFLIYLLIVVLLTVLIYNNRKDVLGFYYTLTPRPKIDVEKILRYVLLWPVICTLAIYFLWVKNFGSKAVIDVIQVYFMVFLLIKTACGVAIFMLRNRDDTFYRVILCRPSIILRLDWLCILILPALLVLFSWSYQIITNRNLVEEWERKE